MIAGLGTAFEEEVAMPTRLKLEDLRSERYTGALGQYASFLEAIEDQSPSYETMANLTSQASSAPQSSLSEWLGETFGSVPQAATPNYDKAKIANEERFQKDQAASKAALAKLRASYGYSV